MKNNVRLTDATKKFFNEGFFRPTRLYLTDIFKRYYTSAGWERLPTNEIPILKQLGFKLNVHYLVGNDAPRGGKCGDFVKLMPRGKRLRIVQLVRAEK